METPGQSGVGPKTEVVYLRIYTEEQPDEGDMPAATDQQQPPTGDPTDEDYWAGRNHAMRKSARIAA